LIIASIYYLSTAIDGANEETNIIIREAQLSNGILKIDMAIRAERHHILGFQELITIHLIKGDKIVGGKERLWFLSKDEELFTHTRNLSDLGKYSITIMAPIRSTDFSHISVEMINWGYRSNKMKVKKL